jgi:hypothetical protein
MFAIPDREQTPGIFSRKTFSTGSMENEKGVVCP